MADFAKTRVEALSLVNFFDTPSCAGETNLQLFPTNHANFTVLAVAMLAGAKLERIHDSVAACAIEWPALLPHSLECGSSAGSRTSCNSQTWGGGGGHMFLEQLTNIRFEAVIDDSHKPIKTPKLNIKPNNTPLRITPLVYKIYKIEKSRHTRSRLNTSAF